MLRFEAVIGLEVHVQLATASKLFCACSTAFGQTPNANVCEVCAGMPGSLPVLNKKAIEYAAKAGLATGCRVRTESVFARKNYFYPDLPMGYQISQFDMPICEHGGLDIPTENGTKHIGITRIHLENDAGKNIHASKENISYVDLNRAGTPLVEIVSEPDMRSTQEAVAYLKMLHGIVTTLGISDGNMEEGNFRCDANVSLRPIGQDAFGTRTELKNLNSFKHVQKAIEYEIARQADILEDHGSIIQETRLYDSAKNITLSMRGKEEAHDYRYFPDPDLLPIRISSEQLETWQSELPELPQKRSERFYTTYGLSKDDAHTLCGDKLLADYFEDAHAASGTTAAKAARFVLGPFLRELNSRGCTVDQVAMRPAAMGELVRIVENGLISTKIAHQIFADIFETGDMPEHYVRAKGMVQISDSLALENAVQDVIAANPTEAEAFKAGKTKLMSFFVGQVMRATKGKANPALVNELLTKHLGG